MAPRYLLDTNVVSQFEKARPNTSLMGWLETVDTEELGIPLNVLSEIQRGILRVAENDPGRAAVISDWFVGLRASSATNLILPNRQSELVLAEMAEKPELREFFMPRGKGIVQLGDDPRIAALAISLDAAVVTFDVDDFQRIHKHFPLPGLFHPGRLEWIVGEPPLPAAKP